MCVQRVHVFVALVCVQYANSPAVCDVCAWLSGPLRQLAAACGRHVPYLNCYIRVHFASTPISILNLTISQESQSYTEFNDTFCVYREILSTFHTHRSVRHFPTIKNRLQIPKNARNSSFPLRHVPRGLPVSILVSAWAVLGGGLRAWPQIRGLTPPNEIFVKCILETSASLLHLNQPLGVRLSLILA